MAQVNWKDDNRTTLVAKGFATEQEAESAAESFLAEQGDEYGLVISSGNYQEVGEEGIFVFKVATN